MHQKTPSPIALGALSLMALATSGCIRNTYTIPADEAARIARAEPDERTRLLARTRVVQDTILTRGPACPAHSTPAAQPAEGEVFPVRSAGLTQTRVASPDVPPECRGDAPGRRDAQALLLTLGTLTAPITLPASQGMRFDGWGQLTADHPVHILYPAGRERRVRLGDLAPQHLTPGAETVLRAKDGGARLVQLESAPLDRVGLVARMELGPTALPTVDGVDPLGFGVRLQAGYFARQWLGFAGGLGFGFASAAPDDLRSFDLDGEIQLMPITAGRMHLGLTAGAGVTTVERVGADRSATELFGLGVSGGLLGEFEVATRLALTARVGVRWVVAENRARDDLTVGAAFGIAVY